MRLTHKADGRYDVTIMPSDCFKAIDAPVVFGFERDGHISMVTTSGIDLDLMTILEDKAKSYAYTHK